MLTIEKNTRLDNRKKAGLTPHHVFTLKIYRPITPSMAEYIVNSWRDFYVSSLCFPEIEYSIAYE